MLLLRCLLLLGIVFGLAGTADAAKKKKAAALKGTVKEVQPEKDSSTNGTITLNVVLKKKKKNPTAAAGSETKTIRVNADTKIEKIDALVKGQKKPKGQLTGQPAKLSDITANALVLVTLKSGSDNVAEKVQILPAKKKKKATS